MDEVLFFLSLCPFTCTIHRALYLTLSVFGVLIAIIISPHATLTYLRMLYSEKKESAFLSSRRSISRLITSLLWSEMYLGSGVKLNYVPRVWYTYEVV